MKPLLPTLAFAFLARSMAMPSAPTGGQTCQPQSQTAYNDTFDQISAPPTDIIDRLTQARLVQGNGTLYFGGAALDEQLLSGLNLPPPSPNNVLGSYRPTSGTLVMTPIQGTMKLVDLRYACAVAVGGNFNAPAACTIVVNCTSTTNPPVAMNLDFSPKLPPLLGKFAYGQFNESFQNLTSCSFSVANQDQLVLGPTLGMLFDNVGYTISTFAQA